MHDWHVHLVQVCSQNFALWGLDPRKDENGVILGWFWANFRGVVYSQGLRYLKLKGCLQIKLSFCIILDIQYNAKVCLSAWPSGLGSRAVTLHCTRFWWARGSNLEAGTVNQTVHPSGLGKLEAISNTVSDCCWKLRTISVRLYDCWRVNYSTGWRKLRHAGSVSPHGRP
jgi:hypothetical protein